MRRVPSLLRLVLFTALTSGLASKAHSQTVAGRVTDNLGQPVPNAMIRLTDATGLTRGAAITDSIGRYELEIPESGAYAIVANRLGYVSAASALRELSEAEQVFTVDLTLRAAPIEVKGVRAVVEGRVEERLRESIGRPTSLLMIPPLSREEVQARAPNARTIGQVFDDLEVPFVTTRNRFDGPCIQYMGKQCLRVYLDGLELAAEDIEAINLQLIRSFVVVSPLESVLYLDGALLMYTDGWLK